MSKERYVSRKRPTRHQPKKRQVPEEIIETYGYFPGPGVDSKPRDIDAMFAVDDPDIFPGNVPVNDLYNSLHRKKKRERGHRNSYPRMMIERALKYQPSDEDRETFERRSELCLVALNSTLRSNYRIGSRRFGNRVMKLAERDPDHGDYWRVLANMDQEGSLSISLGAIGRLLPRGRETFQRYDPFMEVFFAENAYVLRKYASLVAGGNPEKAVVFFAQHPLTIENNGTLRVSADMKEYKPENFSTSSLRNHDVRNILKEVKRRIDNGEWTGRYCDTVPFAQVVIGDEVVDFGFQPSYLNQLENVIRYRTEKYVQFHVEKDGEVYNYKTRRYEPVFRTYSQLVIKEVPIVLQEEELGVHAPKGNLLVKWNGRRKVTNARKVPLLKELIEKVSPD